MFRIFFQDGGNIYNSIQRVEKNDNLKSEIATKMQKNENWISVHIELTVQRRSVESFPDCVFCDFTESYQ